MRSLVAAGSLALIGLVTVFTPPVAAQALRPAANRTAAVYTFHTKNGKLVPSKTFCGVVLNSRTIVTSAKALLSGHGSVLDGPVAPAPPASTFALIRSGANWRIVTCKPIPPKTKGYPLIVLSIDESQQESLAKVLGMDKDPIRKPLEPGDKLQGVIVAAPLGVGRSTPPNKSVPKPFVVPLSTGNPKEISKASIPAAPARNHLPHQSSGAGAWDTEGSLRGILIRYGDQWHIVDAASINQHLTIPTGVKPPPPTPKMPKGIIALMKQYDLKPILDPRLVDYVNQEQADLIMARITGGDLKGAAKDLDDIEHLTSGTLAEQLNYRHGLLMILSGKYTLATQKLQKASEAKNKLVAKRGNQMLQILAHHPNGTIAAGKTLNNPKVLLEAFIALEKP